MQLVSTSPSDSKGATIMADFISVSNDGPKVVDTNYWSSDLARRGMLYLSVNAACIRLFAPSALNAGDLTGVTEVIVSRGRVSRGDAVELLFEDGSNTPFVITLSVGQCDRLPASSDQGRALKVALYQNGQCVREWPARYRIVKRLPCLAPWR
jgi:hypothetical protein